MLRYPESTLRRTALDALYRAAGGVRDDTCDAVANEFAAMLEQQTDRDLPAACRAPFRAGPNDTRKHFVATIPADLCAFGPEDGYVIVDPTIKQFEDAVDTDLPDVAILPPGDPRRTKWYTSVDTPTRQ